MRSSQRLMLVLCMTALAGCASVPTPPDAQANGRAAPPQAPILPSPVAVPIDKATRARLPREQVPAQAHGQTLDCEGVSLQGLLRNAGVLGAPLRGAQLTRYVLVTARDGYRVVYSLAELDPDTGNRRVFLVDRCNGAPLDQTDGPLRLIAPDDARPARWVRQVQSIAVVVAP